MKKPIAVCALLIAVLCSCKRTETVERVRLIEEFGNAEQEKLGSGRGAAFRLDQVSVNGKKFSAIVQDHPGTLRFYLRLGKRPLLKFRVSQMLRSDSPISGIVRIAVDGPHSTQTDYRVKEGSLEKIDLSNFENQIVEISFRASGVKQQRLGGHVQWIDPVIEQSRNSEKPATKKIFPVPRNVMIFLFDAANPSHMGSYGYSRNTTPNIDRLAKEGVLWKYAQCQAASTLASTGSLFTGLYPEAHGVLAKPRVLNTSFKTMAEYFQEAGFNTAMFSGNPNASPAFGYGQGFQKSWVPRYGRPLNAEEFVDPVTTWLRDVQGERFFGYVHFREPHWPYQPPLETLRRFHPDPELNLPDFQNFGAPGSEALQKVVAAYDANLHYADQQFGRILDFMRAIGIDDNTMIIILSDHGEGFWEHGKQGHNYPLYQEIIRIPFLVRFAGKAAAGRIIDIPAGSIDLLPTLVDLFGFSRKRAPFHGRSLLPDVSGSEQKERFLLSQSIYKRMYAIRSEDYKLIHHQHEESEIHDSDKRLSVMIFQDNILRFEVPVNDTFAVRCLKAVADLVQYQKKS